MSAFIGERLIDIMSDKFTRPIKPFPKVLEFLKETTKIFVKAKPLHCKMFANLLVLNILYFTVVRERLS